MTFLHFDAITAVDQVVDHETTMLVGKYTAPGYTTYPYGFYVPNPASAYGYDNGPDFNLGPNFGSVAQPVFLDGTAQVRSIASFYWYGPTSGAGFGYFIQFVIVGTNVPDFDTTFKGLYINGSYIPRSARTNYYADSSVNSNGVYGGPIGPAGHTGWAFGASYLNYFGPEGGVIPIIIDIV